MSDMKKHILQMGEQALQASRELASLSTEQRNAVLLKMADAIDGKSAEILEANAKDIQAGQEKGLSAAMLDRLRLDEERLSFVADCIRQVAALPDPVGEILDEWSRPNGMKITQKRVPIGVIGIIYESRPNVTSDAASLCFKSGNATILKGGSEAIHSNQALAEALAEGCRQAEVSEHCVQLIPYTDRESVKHLAEMDQYLDLIIPRGGQGLIEAVVSMARMPVIKHYDGICHIYVDPEADLDMATSLVVDSKTQKPSVCNALETLLVDAQVAESVLPQIAQALIEKGAELRCDELSKEILSAGELDQEKIVAADDSDWQAEYLDLVLAVKVVDGLDEAVEHINTYGSRHSDCIVTDNEQRAAQFMERVDSAAVFWNVSTRFSDGEEFGFGAEIGISTDKLHARGPMALKELTSYKYLVTGNGQTKTG